MSLKDGLPDYNRQDLRKATKFVEGDYSGINPRQFYRKLKRNLEEIQDDTGFKYQTYGDQERDLEISSEEVGQKTGVIKGRLAAESDWKNIGSGALEYKPYGKFGALGIVLGLLLLIPGVSEPALGVAGILVLIGGAYGYTQTETGYFQIVRQDVLRTLMTGEVSERTMDGEVETRTDIFANMSVVYAGDAFVAVETGHLEQLDSEMRRELVNQVKRWHNSVVADERQMVDVKDGFVWHLTAWTNHSLDQDSQTINQLQSKLLDGPFEWRKTYSELMESQLPQEVQQELQADEENLRQELEELADDLDIYVEREGFKQTNKVEKRQRNNPELESGGDNR